GGGVANHIHRDRDRGRTLGDDGGAAAGDVVAVGDGRAAVGGGVVHAHPARAGRLVEADGEEERVGAAVALGCGGVADAGVDDAAAGAGRRDRGAVARCGRGAAEIGGVVVAVAAAAV